MKPEIKKKRTSKSSSSKASKQIVQGINVVSDKDRNNTKAYCILVVR